MQHIAILGFGTEGQSVFKFLRSRPEYRDVQITILDRDPSLKIPRGIQSILGEQYLSSLDQFDLIFRSPGIPYELPELRAARAHGVQFSSATKLFFKHAKGTIIGITGTKGKGTTSTLIYNILKSAKKDVHLVGNIGKSALAILPKLKKNSIVVFELSSFQLQDLTQSPHVAVVLNIFPDHMDAHYSFAEYLDAKSSIVKFQKSNDILFFAAHNEYAKSVAAQSKGIQIPVTVADWTLFTENDLRIKGPHNFKNAIIAARVAQSLGISNNIILKTVRAFTGLPHRLEIIKTKKQSNIIFVNDSAGTNPSTAAAAIRSFQGPLFLICGGKDKGVSFEPLVEAVRQASNIKGIFLIGENASKIESILEISKSKLQISKHSNLKSATLAAYRSAKKLINLSTYQLATVLFSPASASFDMFTDYKDRGEQFKKIVQGL